MGTHVLEPEAARAAQVRRGRWLEYMTIGWNSLEGLVALAAGLAAGSVALVGFGFDSLIELASGAALLWRLRLDHDHGRRERAEATALRAVGVCFVLLAAYVLYDAVRSLLERETPQASYAGIVLALASLIVMPLLARSKRRVARELDSRALAADSRQTELCAYLSAILLGGLLLNALLGWWWADPLAGLVMTPIIAREGIRALRGEACTGECH